MIVGFILVFVGILCFAIAIISYRKYNKVSVINSSETSETSFNVKDANDYSICVEGVNHGQITTEMVELKNLKNNQTIDIKSIENLSLKNRYKLKNYHNILKFSIDIPCDVKMIIPAYESLKTHHSKYQLVEKYSISKPPIILIHRFYPIFRRLQFLPFLIGCMFFIPIGSFLIFKN